MLMFLVLMVAILFAGGAIYNLVQGDLENFVVSGAIAELFYCIYAFHKNEKQKGKALNAWLIENQAAIYAGNAMYHGKRIELETPLTQMQFCLSLIVFSVKIPSRYMLRDEAGIAFYAVLYTVGSWLFGWWGLPWGPIYTIQATCQNLTGGLKKQVQDILPVLIAEVREGAEVKDGNVADRSSI